MYIIRIKDAADYVRELNRSISQFRTLAAVDLFMDYLVFDKGYNPDNYICIYLPAGVIKCEPS